MADLKSRLYHDLAPGESGESISIHALYAAARLKASGDVTDTQVQERFAISAAEWTQLKNVVASVGAPKLNDVVLLTQTGYLTPAEADFLLGL